MGDFTNDIKISKKTIKALANWKQVKSEKIKECINCGSKNTFGCIIGWTIEQEFFCNNCSHYTLYISEYEF